YKETRKTIEKLTDETGKRITREQHLRRELDRNVKSIDEARDNNKKLRKARNAVNLETEEGQKELKELNAKLNRNNELIKENVSQLEDQKMNVGNYTESIEEANISLNPLESTQGMFNTALEETGDLAIAAQAGMKGFIKSIGAAIRAG